MRDDRELLIRRTVDGAIAAVVEGQVSFDLGGLFEPAGPLVAADVPDASHDKVPAAFASVS